LLVAVSVVRRIPFDPVGRIADGAFELKVLTEAGIIGPVRPDKLARMGWRLARWGASPATAVAVAAIHRPDETAVIDEQGTLTFEEMHRRSNAVAHSLAELGVGAGDGVGIMCRNHRGFIDATLGAAKLGASSLYLNTAFAGRQLVEVMEREGPEVLVYDEEFTELLEGLPSGVERVVAWQDEGDGGDSSLASLIERGDDSDPSPPSEDPRFVILTSGTTGSPKGAQRSNPQGLGGLAALLDMIPFRSGEKMMIAAPLFHSWGFTHFVLSLATGSAMVLRRRFDPEETLRAIAEARAEVLAVVPVMIQRILELPAETISAHDVSSLRITSASGSALPGELALKWMDTFGDNLYNLYGSTEVAYATIATPEDLREAPGTAGLPPRDTVVKIYDEDGKELPEGETGRIFVGNEMAFEGYTGGGGKDEIDGLLSSGDIGHFDEQGRLFIDGRDDEMIVSGGENVFPREVEDLLSDHEAVSEAAVIGVEDEQFGQRLKAFIVPSEGQSPAEDELQGYVKQNLARYKVPREIEFIDELPRNATGKVVKRKLAEREEEQSGREATTGG
jgi:acyl-CoA synthetase (AMP-forming)/AMP-acid ligase II